MKSESPSAETSGRRRGSRLTNTGFVMALLIVGIWVLVALLINPRGEFPLNDDWSYAGAAKALIEEGALKLSGFTEPNLIAQIIWGALFCLPFGFSFTALRISTLTLGVIGVLALYGLLRETDADPGTALFGALLLAFNPLYLVLSYTFMTDVPFVAVSVLSLYFLVRGMRRNSQFEVVAGFFLACVALLIRQNGLAIFIAFGLTYLTKSGLRLRNVFLACMPVALGGAVQVLWSQWLKYRQMVPAVYSIQEVRVLSPRSYASGQALVLIAYSLVVIFVYLGLFLFPLLLFVGRRRLAELCASRGTAVATLGFAIAFLLPVQRWPIVGNVLYNLGLGPATLRDTFILSRHSLPMAGKTPLLVTTFLGVIGAVALVQAILFAVPKAVKLQPFPAGKRESLEMLLSTGLIYLVPVVLLGSIAEAFDRYLIFVVPLGIAVIILLVTDVGARKAGSATMLLAVASLVLYGAFSVAGTHDYLSWNRARWQALKNLTTEQQVSANDIDGGFEFNGWYLYDPNYRRTLGKSWWWVAGDDFMVTFGPVPGYTELRRYPFRRWLPPGGGNILVLRRTTPRTLP